ncbi:MAG TPA: sugar ABC transporter ATP-binding protein [Vicinamibacteria bacterium]|jgi:rhamnose transport system ATP-binding protein|nr:sugar ABC transporter ATP-binding protein [Vicinamibacteria bacterium]
MALLRLRDVSKAFGGVRALRGVSFDLSPGEVHGLVGENGAGKSTLVRILTGALRADSGTVEIDGRRVARADPVVMRERGVAPIYQQPALLPDLSVAENLALGLEPGGAWRRVDWRERRRRADAMLARVGARIDPEAEAGSLGMAEQQLVEIARALGAQARILLMDEPTAALAEPEAERLLGLIVELRGQGVGIVYISHHLSEVLRIADRVTVMRDGAVVETRPATGLAQAELIRLMVGRELTAVFPKRPVARGPVALEAHGLSCRIGGLVGVTLELYAGEILGLAGLVGSGRTELARVLFGLTPADGGELRLRGRPVAIDSPGRAAALGLAYVPEDRRRHGVILEMSVTANVTLAVLRQLTSGPFLDSRRERELASGFVERFAIKTPSLETPVANLSGGNQQKVALARWLATRPSVLILDEPTQGVDVGAKSEIHRLMVDLAEQGLAILMISSELPEILGMSDRIAVMRGGRVVETLSRDAATQQRLLALALGHELAPEVRH